MTTYGYAGRDLGSEDHWVIPQIPQQQALLRLVAERSRPHPPGPNTLGDSRCTRPKTLLRP
jgi:hypothetical protein